MRNSSASTPTAPSPTSSFSSASSSRSSSRWSQFHWKSSEAHDMYLIRDVLDKPLIGRGEDPAGRVDGLIVELRDGQPPRVIAIECGFAVLARRIHPRLEKLVRIIGRRFSPRRGRPYRISWRR